MTWNNKVVLVHIELSNRAQTPADMVEFYELATSASMAVVGEVVVKRDRPDPKYFIGSGKLEEVKQMVLAHSAAAVFFNQFISPAQERNLEKFLSCKTLDRPGLILEIFAQRAQSAVGKLQVELAQLEHAATRLVRGWTHLERQRGGIGLRSGPGETQLEVDRRILQQKIASVKKRLAKLASQRQQNRQGRRRSRTPTIALVGYTNAGKSTLFNALTTEQVYVADKLFATLDPTLRKVYLQNFGQVVLADTVGFIRDLPHELVEAFHATLEETKAADLLLHIIDASDPLFLEKIAAVNKVLKEIGADRVPQLLVCNKIDLCEQQTPNIDYDERNKPERVWLSARTKAGVALLITAIKIAINSNLEEIELGILPQYVNQIRSILYANNVVLSEDTDADGNCLMKLLVNRNDLNKWFGSTVPGC